MDKKLTKMILRVLGFGKYKPKTTWGRALRWTERCLLVLCGFYLLLQFFPYFLFPHSLKQNDIILHSRTPFPRETEQVLDSVFFAISKSELYRPGRAFRVFTCNSRALYTLLAPTRRHTTATCNPFTKHIFIARGYLRRNVSRSFRKTRLQRRFHCAVAHEIGHMMIRNRLGLYGYLRLPTWVNEGYCEYISGESALPEDRGTRLILSARDNRNWAIRYFLWWKMVQYLIDEKGYSFEKLVVSAEDHEKVKQDMLKWLAEKKRNGQIQS